MQTEPNLILDGLIVGVSAVKVQIPGGEIVELHGPDYFKIGDSAVVEMRFWIYPEDASVTSSRMQENRKNIVKVAEAGIEGDVSCLLVTASSSFDLLLVRRGIVIAGDDPSPHKAQIKRNNPGEYEDNLSISFLIVGEWHIEPVAKV